jgi:hypothetical protein
VPYATLPRPVLVTPNAGCAVDIVPIPLARPGEAHTIPIPLARPGEARAMPIPPACASTARGSR